MKKTQHLSVLLQESIEGLELAKGETLLDCTFGGGGHSSLALSKNPEIQVIALDQDKEALHRAEALGSFAGKNIKFLNYNFREIDKALDEVGVHKVDAILFDLGTSVDQIHDSGRGFTFQKDEPLLMTLSSDIENSLTARDIVNTWQEETLETILKGFGEERFARRIAKAIVEAREEKPIETTFELVEIVKRATPKMYHFKKIHPATKTFQAIRIAVNDELNALEEALKKSFEHLNLKGRVAVISFHSLEDRIVKKYFRSLEDSGKGKRITKRPITPSEEEKKNNPKSRSAKLRIFEKTSTTIITN